MDVELYGRQGGVHENVIDREGRQTSGKSAERPPRSNESSHVAQLRPYEPVSARGSDAVKITE